MASHNLKLSPHVNGLSSQKVKALSPEPCTTDRKVWVLHDWETSANMAAENKYQFDMKKDQIYDKICASLDMLPVVQM